MKSLNHSVESWKVLDKWRSPDQVQSNRIIWSFSPCTEAHGCFGCWLLLRAVASGVHALIKLVSPGISRLLGSSNQQPSGCLPHGYAQLVLVRWRCFVEPKLRPTKPRPTTMRRSNAAPCTLRHVSKVLIPTMVSIGLLHRCDKAVTR